AGLAGHRAPADRLERAADVLAFGHDHLPAEDDGAHQLVAQRGVFNPFLDQLLEHRRALRVADQLEAASVVVAGDVFEERGHYTRIGDHGVLRFHFAEEAVDRGERQLRIDRRVDLAYLREARGLAFGDRGLFVVDFFVRVDRELATHRRVDVEAVDRRVFGRLGGAVGRPPPAPPDGPLPAVVARAAPRPGAVQPSGYRRNGHRAHRPD